MMKGVHSRHFVWPGMKLPILVDVRTGHRNITVRTWRLSSSRHISNIVPSEEMRSLISGHAKPFEVDRDPFGLSRKDLWVDSGIIEGTSLVPEIQKGLPIKPISQVGFITDTSILSSQAWSDYGIWLFNCTPNGALKTPYNRFVKTQPTKEHRNLLLQSREESNLLMLCVPFAQDNLNECSFILKYNPDIGCLHNFPEFRKLPSDRFEFSKYSMEQFFGVKALLPSLRLAGPDVIGAGQMADFTVEMFDRNVDALITTPSARLYLESNAGYLTHRQVYTKDGVARFKLIALGLEPGDKIKLKVGWRNYSGADEKVISVV